MVFVRLVLVVTLVLGMARAIAAAPLDFEGFSDAAELDTGYAGFVFSNTIILSSGLSLNEFEFPPRSGANVASDNNGPILITFLSPVQSFSAYFTYAAPLEITAFDGGLAQIGSASSAFSSNLALSGDPGSVANERIDISYAPGMSSVRIAGAVDGGSFVMDDVTISAVPEPGMLVLLTTGLLVVAGAARRRRQTR